MLLGKIKEWNITFGDKLQEETMTLPVTILKQPFWFHLNIILPRLWKLKHRRECTLQSIIIILRYLHSCGKKTKLRQGCTPWYNMFDIHGFHPNSTKFSKKSFNVFLRDRHFHSSTREKPGPRGTWEPQQVNKVKNACWIRCYNTLSQ